MSVVKITLAWFSEWNQFLVKIGDPVNVSPPDKVIFCMVRHVTVCQDLWSDFADHCLWSNVALDQIGNLDDLSGLFPDRCLRSSGLDPNLN